MGLRVIFLPHTAQRRHANFLRPASFLWPWTGKGRETILGNGLDVHRIHAVRIRTFLVPEERAWLGLTAIVITLDGTVLSPFTQRDITSVGAVAHQSHSRVCDLPFKKASVTNWLDHRVRIHDRARAAQYDGNAPETLSSYERLAASRCKPKANATCWSAYGDSSSGCILPIAEARAFTSSSLSFSSPGTSAWGAKMISGRALNKRVLKSPSVVARV